jgi:hypothetical protein
MKRFRLQRLTQTEAGTFGVLSDAENKEVCKTMELPWKDNAHAVSCIPAGEYPAHRFLSPKRGYEVFMLDDVPDRSAIEIHIGNRLRDTDGCVLVGMEYGLVNGEHGITESRVAFVKFMGLVAGEQNIVLTVLDPPPVAV